MLNLYLDVSSIWAATRDDSALDDETKQAALKLTLSEVVRQMLALSAEREHAGRYLFFLGAPREAVEHILVGMRFASALYFDEEHADAYEDASNARRLRPRARGAVWSQNNRGE